VVVLQIYSSTIDSSVIEHIIYFAWPHYGLGDCS